MKDFSNYKFGLLTAVKIVGKDSSNKTKWLCRCECGNEVILTTDRMNGKNQTKSCGCLRLRKGNQYSLKHGKSKSKLYSKWANMKDRCYNSNCRNYKNYGARGIKVCEEWLGENGFANFYSWASKNGYDEDAEYGECTLDRIDVNGNYEPLNCRWVDVLTQNNNMRSNKFICFNDEIHTMAEWSRILSIPYRTLKSRLRKMPIEIAFTKAYKGKKLTITKLQKE